MAEYLDRDQGAAQRGLRLRIVEHRTPVELAVSGHRHRPIEPGPQLDLPRERGGSPLVSQRVHGDLPPVAEPPSRFSFGTTTSSRNSWLNSACPVIWVIGRTSTPGEGMSTISIEIPRWRGTESSVRARSPHGVAY
jgi:hypothetical protein